MLLTLAQRLIISTTTLIAQLILVLTLLLNYHASFAASAQARRKNTPHRNKRLPILLTTYTTISSLSLRILKHLLSADHNRSPPPNLPSIIYPKYRTKRSGIPFDDTLTRNPSQARVYIYNIGISSLCARSAYIYVYIASSSAIGRDGPSEPANRPEVLCVKEFALAMSRGRCNDTLELFSR